MNQTVLITGASNGIGLELAKRFAQDGAHLVLVARSEQKLHDLATQLKNQYKVDVKIMVKDLSKPEAAKEIYDDIKENSTIDILINNAGVGIYGRFLDTDYHAEEEMINLNIKSLTHLTKLFLPDMVKRKKGKILNVASTAAFQAGPLMSVYYATKSYVLSFTEALENELRGTGVMVSALCPGPTETGFGNNAKLEQSKLFKKGVMDVKRVADIGYKGFLKGQTIIIPGLKNRFLVGMVRLLPRKVVTSTVRRVQERV